jgi:hypothetical protein
VRCNVFGTTALSVVQRRRLTLTHSVVREDRGRGHHMDVVYSTVWRYSPTHPPGAARLASCDVPRNIGCYSDGRP